MAADCIRRVLMTADTVGGVFDYAVELAGALSAEGIEVHLATMGGPATALQRARVRTLPAATLHESSYRLEWMEDAWRDVDAAGEWLLGLERTIRADVVHLNQLAFGAWPFVAPKLVVGHSCVGSWWRAVHGRDAPSSWDRYRTMAARGLAGADLVIAPTAAMLEALRTHYGFAGTGRVIANARDAGLYRPAKKSPLVFAAGRFWDDAKNLAALDAVAPDLPWPVRVAGPMQSPDGQLRVAQHVVGLGELAPAAIARELARSAIYALPARYEPFGLSILEAGLAGCALVIGDIPSLREVWSDAALYVPPEDRAALRVALLQLIDDRARREEFASRARARALRFAPERMRDGYLQAYRALRGVDRRRSFARRAAHGEHACAS